jgi:hypothetical protein
MQSIFGGFTDYTRCQLILNFVVVIILIVSFYSKLYIMKPKFNSDGHQFCQYQQNEQSPFILTEINEHKKDHDIWC